jgi:hypothetical protein
MDLVLGLKFLVCGCLACLLLYIYMAKLQFQQLPGQRRP